MCGLGMLGIRAILWFPVLEEMKDVAKVSEMADAPGRLFTRHHCLEVRPPLWPPPSGLRRRCRWWSQAWLWRSATTENKEKWREDLGRSWRGCNF